MQEATSCKKSKISQLLHKRPKNKPKDTALQTSYEKTQQRKICSTESPHSKTTLKPKPEGKRKKKAAPKQIKKADENNMYSHRPKCNSQTGFLKGHTKSKKCYIGETIWEPLKERNNSKISLQSGSNFKSHERTDSVTNKNGTKRNLRKKQCFTPLVEDAGRPLLNQFISPAQRREKSSASVQTKPTISRASKLSAHLPLQRNISFENNAICVQSADPLREQPSNLGNFETFKEQHTSKLVDQKRANDQQIINEMTSIQQFLQLKILELERRNAEVAATNASKYNSLLAQSLAEESQLKKRTSILVSQLNGEEVKNARLQNKLKLFEEEVARLRETIILKDSQIANLKQTYESYLGQNVEIKDKVRTYECRIAKLEKEVFDCTVLKTALQTKLQRCQNAKEYIKNVSVEMLHNLREQYGDILGYSTL